jgi:PAS domain S-box-containing protein
MSTRLRKRLAWALLLVAGTIIVWQGTVTWEHQARLEEAEQRLELALWGSDSGLFDWAAPVTGENWYDTHAWFSTQFKGLLGCDRSDKFAPTGAAFLEYVRYEDRANLIRALDVAHWMQNGFDTIFQAKYRDGTYHWYTMRGRFSENGHGRISGTLLDITPRMQERQRADLIITSSPAAVITCNAERRITMLNPAASTMFGVGKEEMIGEPIDKIVTKEYLDRHNSVFEAAVEKLRAQEHDWMVRREDIEGEGKNAETGEVFPVRLSVRGIKYRGEMEFIATIRQVDRPPPPGESVPLPTPMQMTEQMLKPKTAMRFAR